MKNHIKNYIKIMGLATVPFGTAQVHGEGGRGVILVEKCVLRKGAYAMDVKVKWFFDNKLTDEEAIEYRWNAVSITLDGEDIFPKKKVVSSLKEVERFVAPLYFLHGVVPGIIRDGVYVASFNATKRSKDDKVWSRHWWFTGYLFVLVRTGL